MKNKALKELKDKLFTNVFLKKDSNFIFEDIKRVLNKETKTIKKYNYPINPKNNKYDTSVAGMPICKSTISLFGDDA